SRLIRKPNLSFGPDPFPFADPLHPTRHIAALASGSAVRSDDPFRHVQTPVRKAIAIDMEGAAFYRAIADFPGTRSLLVKSISDYADSAKDNSYHNYAGLLSAVYILAFIQEYVTDTLMP